MQAEILNVLQQNFSSELADSFIARAKKVIKFIIELLQKKHLI